MFPDAVQMMHDSMSILPVQSRAITLSPEQFLMMQPVSESETDEDPPPKQSLSLSPLPDRIGFIGAGQVRMTASFQHAQYRSHVQNVCQ